MFDHGQMGMRVISPGMRNRPSRSTTNVPRRGRWPRSVIRPAAMVTVVCPDIQCPFAKIRRSPGDWPIAQWMVGQECRHPRYRTSPSVVIRPSIGGATADQWQRAHVLAGHGRSADRAGGCRPPRGTARPDRRLGLFGGNRSPRACAGECRISEVMLAGLPVQQQAGLVSDDLGEVARIDHQVIAGAASIAVPLSMTYRMRREITYSR